MMMRLGILLSALALSACVSSDDLDQPPPDLGNFSLGHNVVVAPKVATASSISREVSEEQLTEAMKTAIADRFDRYNGEKEYHFGVSIEGYVLARAGVPVIAAPKSAMIIRLTVWDDAAGAKLNVPPEQITVLEDIDGESLVGTGWTQNAEKQLEGLAENAAKAIETFLLEQNAEKGWFKASAGDVSGSAAASSEAVLQSPESGAAVTE